MLIDELAVAIRFAAVDELAPREVVEMTVGARDDEAHGERRARGFRVMYDVIDVALLGGVRDVVELEGGLAVEAIETSAYGASEPFGEESHGDAFRVGRRRRGRRHKAIDVRTDDAARFDEKAFFFDLAHLIVFPFLNPHGDDGKALKVGDRARSGAPNELAWAKTGDRFLWRRRGVVVGVSSVIVHLPPPLGFLAFPLFQRSDMGSPRRIC